MEQDEVRRRLGAASRASAITGDASAAAERHFADTYRRERRFLLNTVRRLGVPPADVEDAVQDVFIVLHSRFHQLERGAALRFWLAAVAVRICRNRRRSISRRTGRLVETALIEAAVPSRQSLPDESSSENERRRLLLYALKRLDSKKRQVFVLADLEQHTADEIATLTQVPRNTVTSRLRIARRRVAASLRIAQLTRR